MSGRAPRHLPDTATVSRDAPIAAWLHPRPGEGRGHVAVTFPGTYRAISLTRVQVTRLRKALVIAEALLARDDIDDTNSSIDLMKRITE